MSRETTPNTCAVELISSFLEINSDEMGVSSYFYVIYATIFPFTCQCTSI